MKVLIFGGFLGSGKTTIIRNLIKAIRENRAGTVAVIENEIGTFGVDDLLIGEAGVKIRTLTGGCVCCQITGSLIAAMKEIDAKLHPDWLVIELSGIAYLSGIKETIFTCAPEFSHTYTIAVADASRWQRLLRAAEPLIRNQVCGSDLIIVNKCDLNENAHAVAREAASLGKNDRLLLMNAAQDSGDALLNRLQEMEVE